jgi:hypothetical protein
LATWLRKTDHVVGEMVTCAVRGRFESRMWMAEVTATSTHSPPLLPL